jgi:hypothetical protein
MPFRQIERLRLATERDRNIFHELVELALGRFPFLLRDFVEIHFAHMALFLVVVETTYRESSGFLVAIEKTAIPIQIMFTKDEG